MEFSSKEIAHVRRLVEDGERRVAAQEDLIERLHMDGHAISEAQSILQSMRDILNLRRNILTEITKFAEISLSRNDGATTDVEGSVPRS